MKEIEREKKLSFAETNMFLCKELLLNFFLKGESNLMFHVEMLFIYLWNYFIAAPLIIKSFDRKTKNT